MFKELTDFGHQRNKKGAVGFYIAYLLLATVIGALLAMIFALATGENIQTISDALLSRGEQVAAIFIAISSTVLSLIILSAKKESRYIFVLLALIGGMISFFGGGLFGFIVPACFTTLRPRE